MSFLRNRTAFDLMEPVRPQVDAFLLDILTRQEVKREWFFEQRDGNCRLMAGITAMLAETTGKWAAAVEPIVRNGSHRSLDRRVKARAGRPRLLS